MDLFVPVRGTSLITFGNLRFRGKTGTGFQLDIRSVWKPVEVLAKNSQGTSNDIQPDLSGRVGFIMILKFVTEVIGTMRAGFNFPEYRTMPDPAIQTT